MGNQIKAFCIALWVVVLATLIAIVAAFALFLLVIKIAEAVFKVIPADPFDPLILTSLIAAFAFGLLIFIAGLYLGYLGWKKYSK